MAAKAGAVFRDFFAFAVFCFRSNQAIIVFGSHDLRLVRMAVAAQPCFAVVHYHQRFAACGMWRVAGLADNFPFLAELATHGRKFFRYLIQYFQHGMIDAFFLFRILFMASHAHAGFYVGNSKEYCGFLLLPGQAVGAVTGAAIDIALIVKRENSFPVFFGQNNFV